MFEDRTVLGFVEHVTFPELDEEVEARIDTGATVSSVDAALAEALAVEHTGHRTIKSSHGTTKRKVVELTIILNGKKVTGEFTVFDRSHMTYPVLIGQNILKQNFIIDPLK